MRYRADVYDKLFPRPIKHEKVESNVESFKPTEEEEVRETPTEEVTDVEEVEEVSEPSEEEVADE